MPAKIGRHKATMIDYGFTKPKPGKQPRVAVYFKLEDGHNITWFGSFNGGAKDITVRTLVEIFGYSGSTGEEIAKGIGSNALNEKREYDVEVDHEQYEGKTYAKVKYVNISGQQRQMEKLESSEAKTFLGGLNLKGDFMAAKKNVPAESKPSEQDDIPF